MALYQNSQFGIPNTSLTGDRYTAVYSFNIAIGLNVSSAGVFDIFGGSGTAALGQPSPALGALITIGGQSVFIDGSYAGQIYGTTHELFDYVSTAVDRVCIRRNNQLGRFPCRNQCELHLYPPTTDEVFHALLLAADRDQTPRTWPGRL